jgi:hypothetical protein
MELGMAGKEVAVVRFKLRQSLFGRSEGNRNLVMDVLQSSMKVAGTQYDVILMCISEFVSKSERSVA